MNDRLEKLNDIKIENMVWLVYIGIIILSYYANSKEKKYLLYNDQKAKKEYQDLLIIIFSILMEKHLKKTVNMSGTIYLMIF